MSTQTRLDGRGSRELRPLRFTPHVSEYAEGSVLVEYGKTRVLCTASLEEQVPKWVQNSGAGWVTAEYGMLPRSTHSRMKRDKILEGGRTLEISRLVGRSLRAAVDLRAMSEKQITVDCDVINADGGTRTAAISGGFVALGLALQKLKAVGEISKNPLMHYVAAVSVGFMPSTYLLDLNYDEDSSTGADVNFVMNDEDQFIEVQGTAETLPFGSKDFAEMMELARQGCQQIFKAQEEILGEFFPRKKLG